MTRFNIHRSGSQLLTGRIFNAIRTFFVGFWATLTGHKQDEQYQHHEHQSIDYSSSKHSEKYPKLRQTNSMKKSQRIKSHQHLKHAKTNKHVHQAIKHDYGHKNRTHSFSRICKSVIL